ncbi:Hypothetical predicted protein [Mytilus galloprovincialis]|uniref:YqaJ viral recombinase domain-containing protein n=1 Tax=Mytilus galloprovincialis TaxID=29158 RepID=A0A8B6BUF6_MYTGA|nr:Hypothetical predicted protein [Mytilus galloprovincialis]
MGNENVPGLRDTPFYVSKEEFKEAVNASPMLPLFEIKGTIMNKSFKSNPSVRTQESIEQVHGEHNDLLSCAKCVDNRLKQHFSPKAYYGKTVVHRNIKNPNACRPWKGICVSQHENWLSASPDGIFDGQTLLEIKCPVPSSSWSTLDQLFESGKYDVGKDENGDLVVKEKGSRGIYLQVQLTMYCTGLKQCKLLVWLGVDEHKYIDILYNETYVNNQVTRLKTFYVKKLLPC